MPRVAVSLLHLRKHLYIKAGGIAVGVNGAPFNFILGCGCPTATVYQQVDVECDGTLRNAGFCGLRWPHDDGSTPSLASASSAREMKSLERRR